MREAWDSEQNPNIGTPSVQRDIKNKEMEEIAERYVDVLNEKAKSRRRKIVVLGFRITTLRTGFAVLSTRFITRREES